MFFKNALLERIIKSISKASVKNGIGLYNWGDDESRDNIIYYWKNYQPIPFVDKRGNHYIYLRKDNKIVVDNKLSEKEKEWLEFDLPIIQEAAINAAAQDKQFISIDSSGHIEGTDSSITLSARVMQILTLLCDMDAERKTINNNKIIIQWDD